MQTTTPVSRPFLHKTRPLAYLAKWALRAVFVLGVLLALASQATAAPVVFTVLGEFNNGSGYALSGTITIDTATGKVVAVDLAAKYGGALYATFTSLPYGVNSNTKYGYTTIYWELTNPPLPAPGAFASLMLVIPASTLVGYAGGPLPADTKANKRNPPPAVSLLAVPIYDYAEREWIINYAELESGSLEPE